VNTKSRGIHWDLNNYPWPFEDSTFKTAVALQVIEHLDHPPTAIAETLRVAGRLVLSLPWHWQGGDMAHRRVQAVLWGSWVLAAGAVEVRRQIVLPNSPRPFLVAELIERKIKVPT